ncbi:MAG: pitrilysin family protein, partial [Candidatus Paceibacterota bacterium]
MYNDLMDNRENLKKTKLSNGLNMLIYEMPWARSVTAQLWVNAGSRFEKKINSGISHFLEHMLFEGTKDYPTNRELNKAISSLGGDSKAYTSKEEVFYQMKFPSENGQEAINFLYEIISGSLLSESTIEKEKNIITQELARERDNPEAYKWQALLNFLWSNDSSLGRNTIGTKESVARITREDLINFKDKMYIPSNMTLVITGNIKSNEAIEAADNTFGLLKNSGPNAVYPAVELAAHNNRTSRVYLEKMNELGQIYIMMGFTSNITFKSPSYIASEVLNQMLSLQIFDSMVYKKGLSYSANSFSWSFKDHTLETLMVEIDPAKLLETVKVMVDEVKNLSITSNSLNEAKSELKKSNFLDLSDTDKLADFFGEQEFFGQEVLLPEEVKKRIDEVGVSDLIRLKEEILNYSNVAIAILGHSG